MKCMKFSFRLLFPLALLSACSPSRRATQPSAVIDRQSYISQYKDLAIKEMGRSGVPASITMAQALVESDNGNSTLARKGNNHFGIKCHREWKGGRIHHDDDERGECFRKYRTVYESYRDHSDFLRSGVRYAFLFELDPTDYRSWASGLKMAGYATNRLYDEMLIRIIEDNQLYLLDRGITTGLSNNRQARQPAEPLRFEEPPSENYEFSVSLASREVMKNNRIDYIIARQGDTFQELAREFNLMLWEIFRYNELPRDAQPQEGQIVYLQPKRNRAAIGLDTHTVAEGEDLYTISQKYGIRLARLQAYNMMEEGTEPPPGTILWLRKKGGYR